MGSLCDSMNHNAQEQALKAQIEAQNRSQILQSQQRQLIQPRLEQKEAYIKKQVIPQQKMKQNAQDANNECPICLCNKTDTKTICNHYFCSVCITQTLRNRNYCPLCRRCNPLPSLNVEIPEKKQISQAEWNLQVIRRIIKKPINQEQNQIYLQGDNDQQPSNIFVSKNAKIQVSPNVNLFINGRRVQNPQQCSQQ